MLPTPTSATWRDMTDGANGGIWEKLHDEVDTGGWGTGVTPCASGVDPAQIMTGRISRFYQRR